MWKGIRQHPKPARSLRASLFERSLFQGKKTRRTRNRLRCFVLHMDYVSQRALGLLAAGREFAHVYSLINSVPEVVAAVVVTSHSPLATALAPQLL